MKLKKRCKTYGCPNLHSNVSGYCDECTAAYRRNHPSTYEKSRPSAHKRGYDYKWQKFRRDFLAVNPVCAMCGAKAEVVDHKDIPADVMLEAYGSFDLDPSHYQALCRRCNTLKGLDYDKKAREAFHQDQNFLETRGRG